MLDRVEQPRFSTLIVDSAPSSNEVRTLSVAYGASYVLSPLIGLSRARNIGARAVTGDIIAFLDDDMEPHPLWLQELVDGFLDENVGAVTGPMLNLEARGCDHDELCALLQVSSWGHEAFGIDRYTPEWFERANFGGVGDGNFAIRRSAFDQFGGFDERLGRGATLEAGEDHYAFFRLLNLGYKITYQPAAIVFHPTVPRNHVNDQRLAEEAISYAAFLAWNHPKYAARVAKFLVGGLLGAKRSWRHSPPGTSVSTFRKLLGAASGVRLFARSLVERGEMGTHGSTSAAPQQKRRAPSRPEDTAGENVDRMPD